MPLPCFSSSRIETAQVVIENGCQKCASLQSFLDLFRVDFGSHLDTVSHAYWSDLAGQIVFLHHFRNLFVCEDFRRLDIIAVDYMSC